MKIHYLPLFFFIGICTNLLLNSCANSKKDTYYNISDAQKQFISNAHAGDTVMWKSSLGYVDTAIIQPLVYQNFLITSQNDGNDYGQRAYYEYKFVGVKKTNIGYGIGVKNQNSNIQFLGTYCSLLNNMGGLSNAQGLYTSKKIGGTLYNNVYWCIGFPNVADSVFWNNEGCLGTTYNSDIVYKIK